MRERAPGQKYSLQFQKWAEIFKNVHLTFNMPHPFVFCLFLAFFLISIICGPSMCFQLCVKVSDSTRWLQNKQDLYLWSAGRHTELFYPKNTISDSYLQRYIWDFLWYPFTHAQTHTTHSECAFNIFQFFKTLHPLNFPTLALTWNSSKHMRQVSFAISMATGKMGSYTVILPIRRFGRLSFSLWIPEWNAQIKINTNKGKCSQNLNENQF